LKKIEWPDKREIVIIKISEIMPYGAKAQLVEYGDKEGFIHISAVASSWVKNIRSFLSVGEIRAAEVVRVDPQKGIINLSLRNVSQQQQKRKMDDWRREKRADKMFEAMCKDLKEDYDKSYEKIAIPLIKEYGDLLAAFESVKAHGDETFEGIKITKKWKDKITEFAEKNVTLPQVQLKGELQIKFNKPNGLELIKKSLKTADKDASILYLGAPKYQITLTSNDYPTAEKELNSILEKIETTVKKNGGEFSFTKIKA